MQQILSKVNSFVWGVPALALILFAGLYLTIGSKFAQIRLFPNAIRGFFENMFKGDKQSADVSSFQSLCTALAATVGTGNIAGVAGAICLGGPGAVFWMWICALLGMIVKFSEAVLSVHFQTKGPDGRLLGGPMQVIERGLGSRFGWLATIYSFFGVVASLGVGNSTQVNAVLDGIRGAANLSPSPGRDTIIGVVIALIVTIVLLGGAKRIGSLAEKLIPFASASYIILGLGVIVLRVDQLPLAIRSIFVGAFTPSAVTGGVIGSFFLTLRLGISRGIFTNEAGMGTAGMSYAGAKVTHPVEQGMMGIIEVFLDTVVICTITALAILCSGVNIHFGVDKGAALTSEVFRSVYGQFGGVAVAVFLCLFAFATMLGWGLYGARCAQYLFGCGAWKYFSFVQAVVIVLSCRLQTGFVWLFAEIMNGLMAIPNLIAVIILSPIVLQLIQDYRFGSLKAAGGTNESFNQCKSLRTLSYEKVSSLGCGGRATGEKDFSFEYWSAGSGNT